MLQYSCTPALPNPRTPYLIWFIILFIVIPANSILPFQEDEGPLKHKLFLHLSSGIHFGDHRFHTSPFFNAGVGYYFSNGFALKAGYTPLIVSVKNNNYMKYTYKGSEMSEGDKITIDQIYITAEYKIYKNIWMQTGFAPEEKFAILTSLKYNYLLNSFMVLSAESGLLLVGTPTTFENEFFRSFYFVAGLSFMMN